MNDYDRGYADGLYAAAKAARLRFDRCECNAECKCGDMAYLISKELIEIAQNHERLVES